MMQLENPRFTQVYTDSWSGHYILKDNVTGVLYYLVEVRGQGTGAGLTPLLGPDGKPIVDPVE